MSTSVPEDDDPFYSYRPRFGSPPLNVWLRPLGLEWSNGRRSGFARYDRIRRLRLSYRPATTQNHRFIAEIWSDGAPKVQIASASWQGLTLQERQDAAYRTFVTELHRRLAAIGSPARLECGMAQLTYGIGMAVAAACAVAFTAIAVQAIRLGNWRAVAVVLAIFAVLAWQLGNSLVRNRPGRYRPDAIPSQVLPRA